MFEQAKREEEILAFWEEQRIFQQTLDKTSPKGNFIFYEGPPTANGLPGIHHILARSFKDLIPRFRTMQGYHVERRAGWDTHGLPVELQVQKELGLKGKPDIEKFGIAEFNKRCRESVWQHRQEWEQLTRRMGFWLDMDKPYVTYENSYIESVWWILRQIWDQGLIYQGHKVVPHCPSCGTTLSTHEVAQGYQTVTENSVYIKCSVSADSKVAKKGDYILTWTTTPWTLPGNVALAVGDDISYVVANVDVNIHNASTKEFNKSVIKKNTSAKFERWILAKNLIDQVLKDYTFEIIQEFKGSDLKGTKYKPLWPEVIKGTEHSWEVLPANFVTTTDGTGIVHTAVMYGVDDYDLGLEFKLPQEHTVDLSGHFRSDISGLGGLWVKDEKTEKLILNYLEKKGNLLRLEPYEHEYPFCWRCSTPLLYYAKTSWFIAMSKLQARLLKNAEDISWYPEHIKRGRFGEWLQGIKDWAISRERYWGTPLPIWQCVDCQKQKCLGSMAELPQPIEDLHRPYIDEVALSCDCGGVMHRVPEVLDVWFDSGAMPFAQEHYPFDNEELIDGHGHYPADFICEAIDQTRGWFYTLLAISTLLNKGTSYKNVICLGHINDAKGQKMSKSKGNIVDPWKIMNTYGVDPLRYHFYTMSQPGESKNFDENNVLEVNKKVLFILYNMVSFYKMFVADDLVVSDQPDMTDVMDRWVVAYMQQTIERATVDLDNYRITEAARTLGACVNEISTWYIRRSRDRFKDAERKEAALKTLAYVLHTLAELLAPFMPMAAEVVWQDMGLKNFKSVHLSDWPQVVPERQDSALLQQMDVLRNVVEAAHAVRAQAKMKVRQPLAHAAVISNFSQELLSLLADEINVVDVVVEKVLPQGGSWIPAENGLVALDVALTEELRQEGLVRELVRQTNSLRKQARLTPKDVVRVNYQTASQSLRQLIQQRLADLQAATISREWTEKELFAETLTVEVGGESISLSVQV